MKGTITAKGQVTVPEEIRDQLGLLPGTSVVFELRPDGVVLRKGDPEPHPVDRVYGILQLESPVDEVIEEMRGSMLS